jgi:hypothetical protein
MRNKLTILVLFGTLASPLFGPAARGQEGQLDMTQVARQFPTPKGPTTIFVNFDGWRDHDQKGHTLLPFESKTGKRNRDIQEILYRASEIFAPFNVRVMRIFGEGKYDHSNSGNTTIFIGAHTEHVTAEGRKYPHGFTPGKYSDRPNSSKPRHQPHSNPYNLAFIDPVGEQKNDPRWSTVWDNSFIALTIAHEGGHTFGLSHVLSKGFPEVMSYDAGGGRTHFANRTFQTSDLAYNPVNKTKEHKPGLQPKWDEATIISENSYTCLMALLGPRPPDDHPNVVDSRTVDPTYREGTPSQLNPGSVIQGEIAPRGDYDAFKLEVGTGSRPVIQLRPAAGSKLRPVLFVFDATGQKLLDFAVADATTRLCEIRSKGTKKSNFRLVVGALDGATTGGYEVSVTLDTQLVSR